MNKINFLTSINIVIVLLLLFSNLYAKEISNDKIKCKYNIVYISQRDLNSDYLSHSSFDKIIMQLTHKRRLGVGELTVMRTDNGTSKVYTGKDYDFKDDIFIKEVTHNNCETEIKEWFKCALESFNGPKEYVYLLNTSDKFVESIVNSSIDYNVYNNLDKLIEDINNETKMFRKSKETKTIVILHYQDSGMDPCLNLKLKIEDYYNSLRVEFINVQSKKRVRAKGVSKYDQNYYQLKCNHISDFNGYEIILSTNAIPDLTLLFSINDGGTYEYNEHFSILENNQIHFYISENIIQEHIKKYYRGELAPEETYYDLLWRWSWNITIRGYGGEKCPEVFGPINTVSNTNFSCH